MDNKKLIASVIIAVAVAIVFILAFSIFSGPSQVVGNVASTAPQAASMVGGC